jgi:hypothetical protein
MFDVLLKRGFTYGLLSNVRHQLINKMICFEFLSFRLSSGGMVILMLNRLSVSLLQMEQ